jgi:two-component system, cell cycle response regulator
MSARVLLIDDSAGSIALLQAQLASEYMDVLVAHDGSEALGMIGQCHPDLVLVDAVMPGMDGFEVCRRIKREPTTTHLPVVMVTTLDRDEDRMAALEAGADDFMTKPIHLPTLMARVRRLAQSKMVIDELRMRERSGREMGIEPSESVTLLDVDVTAGQVLLICENRDTVREIRTAMTPTHQVHVDRDAEDALLVVARAELDLVVVDLTAEGTHGLRICSRLRSMDATRETPILAILDERQIAARVRALEIGVDGIITLPVHPGALLACVASRLRRKRYSDHLRQMLRRSLERAVKDPLTSMHNRRYLERHLGQLVAQNVERGRPVSLLILDVDHFKAVNDTYGHDVGDQVLREVASRITTSLRGIDLSCRFGGEEFVAAFSGVDTERALQIADRLRRKIGEEPFSVHTERGPLTVTVSIGAATSHGGDTAESLLKRADNALYRAKKDGRNRVVADP